MDPQWLTLAALLAATLIIFALACAAAFGSQRSRSDEDEPAPPAPAPSHAPSQGSTHACPVAGVHTYALSSVEETAGSRISIYRCTMCGDVERWIAA